MGTLNILEELNVYMQMEEIQEKYCRYFSKDDIKEVIFYNFKVVFNRTEIGKTDINKEFFEGDVFSYSIYNIEKDMFIDAIYIPDIDGMLDKTFKIIKENKRFILIYNTKERIIVFPFVLENQIVKEIYMDREV